MRARFRHASGGLLLTAGLALWLAAAGQPESSGRLVTLLQVQDAIGPATSDFIRKGVAHAAEQNAILVVLEMDTPGGLDTAMREIIQAILASPVPVVTYVSPQGARAASAGTYILYASHVAAMAPATNLGAATPVAIGAPAPAPPAEEEPEGARPEAEPDTGADAATREPTSTATEPAARVPAPATASERKAINDAVAYIRSLAERRGRNSDWAERAVRSAESLSAEAALANGVIDLIATDVAELLLKLDGREVALDGGTVTLATTGAAIERFEPDWRTRFLAVISNPTVAYMLMLLGIYGLIFEGYNPGAIVPGVVGAIALLLALFAFQILPVNYAGLALILLGVILMIAEFMVPSFGALGLGGIVAFVFGSLILIDTDVPGFTVATPLISSIATVAAALLLGTIWLAMRARAAPIVSGAEQLTRLTATALADFAHEGDVWVHSERWRARSSTPVKKGQTLRITRVDGLTLEVAPVANDNNDKER
jgi:membrane-bound serine protease (ClpP class)